MPRKPESARNSLTTSLIVLTVLSLLSAMSAVWSGSESRLARLESLRSLADARKSLREWLARDPSRTRWTPGQSGVSVIDADLVRWDLRWEAYAAASGIELRVRLESGGFRHVFRCELVPGALPDCFAEQLITSESLPEGMELRGEAAARFGDATHYPFQDPADWPEHFHQKLPRDLGSAAQLLAPADELPLRYLGRSSLVEDFQLRCTETELPQALLPSDECEFRVRVDGDLWLGRPGGVTCLDLDGRTLAIFVRGDVHVVGDIDLRGARDRLVVVAGRLSGRGGRLHFGLPGRERVLRVEGTYLAGQGAEFLTEQLELVGHFLIRGPLRMRAKRMLCQLERPMTALDPRRPLRGVSLAPGTERLLRLTALEALDGPSLRD